MARSSAAPLQRAEDKPARQKWLSHSCAGAVAFLVFFAGAARTGIIAADFGAGADGLGRFGLRGAGLILQIFLLALLAALDLPGDFRETLRLACCGARGGAGHGGLRASGPWRRSTTAGRLRPKLHFVGMLF